MEENEKDCGRGEKGWLVHFGLKNVIYFFAAQLFFTYLCVFLILSIIV